LVSTSPAYSETYTYDSAGRQSATTISVGGITYTYNTTYDTTGQVSQIQYPTSTAATRFAVQYTYQRGQLQQVQEKTGGTSGPIFWQATTQNARGQITKDQLGNGIIRTKAFDAVTGWQANIQAGVGGGAALLNQSYAYDLVGNVTQRQDSNAGLTESFYYDDLYRLSSSQLNGTTNLTVNYDAMGNITNRSDVASGATWAYHPTKKHAVQTAGANSYGYDANGNMTSRAGSSIAWTSYNYASSMPVPGGTATFSYGGNRNKIISAMPHPDGGLIETTYTIGNLLEKSTRGSAEDWRHYVKANGETVAIVSRKSSGVNTTNYTLRDIQGSPAVIASSTGSVVQQQSYSAFGAPRNGTTWSGTLSTADQTTMANISRQGYTDQTMIGFGGLIHMNGRIQDSITGRFLSPDPYIPHPGMTQSYNRYAYVRNNPMTLIDPSGFRDDEAFPRACNTDSCNAQPELPGVTVSPSYQLGGAYQPGVYVYRSPAPVTPANGGKLIVPPLDTVQVTADRIDDGLVPLSLVFPFWMPAGSVVGLGGNTMPHINSQKESGGHGVSGSGDVPTTCTPSQAQSSNFNKGAAIGGLMAGGATLVVLNIIGFPEVEAAEGLAAIGITAGGARTLAVLDGVAGEPLLSRLMLSVKMGAGGAAVTGTAAALATSNTGSDCAPTDGK
jgi:RHS repeat-associated protein